jgi:hypothetical protein
MRLRFLRTKKGIALLATLVVAAGAAVAAYAYFTTGASGTASAGVGGPTALTIAQKGTISDLLPGGPAAPVDFTIHNPTAGDLGVNYVLVQVTGTNAGAACTAANFQVNQNYGNVGEIDAGQTYDSTTDPGPHSGTTVQMVETHASQDGCEGATVNLTFTAYP